MYKSEEELRKRRLIGGGIAAATAGAVILASALVPMAASALDGADPTDPSAAQGRILSLDADLLAGLNLAAIGETSTSNPSAPGTPGGDIGSLDVALINDIVQLDLGSLQLPLLDDGTNNGLLSLGDAGALSSYSISPSTTSSTAAAGVLGESGAIDLGAVEANTAPAHLELTDLLGQLGLAGLTDQIVDQVGVEIGTLAARAEKNGTTLESEYALADLDLDIHSPLVGDLSGALTTAVGDVVAPVNGIVGEDGLLTGVLSSLSTIVDSVNLALVRLNSDPEKSTLAITGLDTLVNSIVSDLLQEEISNGNGSVVIDLGTGTIHVDLAELAIGANGGDPTNLENLNGLPANTEVLSADVVSAITSGVTESLIGTSANSLTTKLTTALDQRLWNEVGISINVNASGEVFGLLGWIPLAEADITIQGSLAQFTGKNGATLTSANISTDLDLLGVIPIGSLLNPIVAPLIGVITSSVTGPLLDLVTGPVLGGVQSILQDGIVEGALAPLLSVLEPLLQQLVSLRINEQPTEPPLSGQGNLPGDSFTVNALSLTLLPALSGGVNVALASATVKSLDAAAAAAVDAADTVQAGTDLAITGTGWPAETEVEISLTAPDEGPLVGTAQTVETNVDGEFTVDYPVPGSTPAAAGYTVTATAGELEATDTTEVTAAAVVAALEADDTVQAGNDLGVTGTGWPAETEVSVQLSAPNDGPNVGTAQTVETDVDGEFTLDYPVPATTAPGEGYVVTGTAGTDTASTTTEVTAAPANVDAADTVPAGTNLGVTGTGWPSESTVTLQLTTPDGATEIGGPETAETDEAGAFTAAYPVPAGTTPGEGYILNATSGEATDSDTTEITAGEPGDVNTNAAASASASADATADADPAAQAAAVAAALANADSDASAAADVTANAAASAAATTDASSESSATATSAANASAAAAAQAAAQADASSDVNASASTAANANSSSSSEAAATSTSSADASSEASANANAAASASASATADASTDAVAEAAAQASAYSDDDASASAAATAAANAAAQSAATATSTTDATADATSAANAGAAIAAQAAALADASSNTAADTSADSDASTSAAANASAAAIADASTDASTDAASTAEANTNATASAAASAQADDDNNAAAQAAAVAAALADASTSADAAADPDAEAAAAAAATSTANASTDATSEANVAAAASAQAAAQADNSSDTSADATQEANANASSAASVAATATSSADASLDAAADSTASATATTTADATATADASTAANADVNVNASASASASANADDDSNASAEAAAVAAALADATSTASAAADVTANAAAEAAATDDASTDASTTADSDVNVAAAASAQAAAQNDATSTSAADADAEADADPNAASAVAANASSSSTASATAAADASAEADAESSAQAAAAASADAAADSGTKLGIIIKVPVLQRGGQQTAIGTGFAPGEVVTGVMRSDEPLSLGTQIADAQGNVTFTWAVPASTDLGTHTVTLSGATSGSVAATFEVVGTGLATTGGELPNPWLLMGALLLLFGLGATLVGRSKRTAVSTEQ